MPAQRSEQYDKVESDIYDSNAITKFVTIHTRYYKQVRTT